MEENRMKYGVRKMAGVFGVSASGFYRSLFRPICRRSIENTLLLGKVQTIHKMHRSRYGSPRITLELRDNGILVSKNRVARLMRENSIIARHKKKFRHTTDSSHKFPVSENLLNRDFNAARPGEKWVSDITYILTSEKWLYLCEIIDLYDHAVVGWSLEDHLETGLLVKAWKNAVNNRIPERGMIFHSDRGVQYCSQEFRKKLKECGKEILQSMSRKGNCWDNAVAESFHSILKRELDDILDGKHGCKEVRKEIFEFIEMYYNRRRRHSTLGYQTPLQKLESA